MRTCFFQTNLLKHKNKHLLIKMGVHKPLGCLEPMALPSQRKHRPPMPFLPHVIVQMSFFKI